jgi:hypothetical protein
MRVMLMQFESEIVGVSLLGSSFQNARILDGENYA